MTSLVSGCHVLVLVEVKPRALALGLVIIFEPMWFLDGFSLVVIFARVADYFWSLILGYMMLSCMP